MARIGNHTQQSRERWDYDITYDLTPGDNLVDSEDAVQIEVTPTGPTISRIVDVADATVKVWFEGGTGLPATKYKVTVLAQSADGRKIEDEFTVTVKDT